MVLGTSGTSVVQQAYTGADNQLWRIQNVGASHFKIQSVASGKVMDVSEGSREAGTELLQYEWNGGYNQKFQIIDCGNGYHRFVNVNTLGKTIEIENSSTSAGAKTILGNFAYKDNQLWRIKAVSNTIVSDKLYMIENRGSGKVCERVASTESSTLTQGTGSKKETQVWKLEELFNGNYIISSINNNYAIDNMSSSQNNTNVGFAAKNENFSQQWQIVQVESAYYKLVNRYSGKLLDNKDGSTSDGTSIIQYSDYASTNTNQQWKFVPIDGVAIRHDDSEEYQKVKSNAVLESKNKGFVAYDFCGRVVRNKEMSSKNGVLTDVLSGGVYIVKSGNAGEMKFVCK